MVDISMLDVQVALHTYRAKYFFVAGEIPQPVGTAHVSNVPLGGYRTKDSYIVIEAYMDHFYKNLCRAMGIESMVDDPRFNSRAKRLQNRQELDEILEENFLKKKTDEWLHLFYELEIPSGPINTLDKVFADPQVLARNMVVEMDSPSSGKVQDVGNPIKISGVDKFDYRPPPALGEHTEQILRGWLAYPSEKISALRSKNII